MERRDVDVCDLKAGMAAEVSYPGSIYKYLLLLNGFSRFFLHIKFNIVYITPYSTILYMLPSKEDSVPAEMLDHFL